MTNQHPITVPLDLIEDWRLEPEFCDGKKKIVMVTVSRERMQYIADQAARWGADQELEACCEWFIRDWNDIETADKLHAARRPKPPSLKEQALSQLESIQSDLSRYCMGSSTDTIRRALEQLDD